MNSKLPEHDEERLDLQCEKYARVGKLEKRYEFEENHHSGDRSRLNDVSKRSIEHPDSRLKGHFRTSFE